MIKIWKIPPLEVSKDGLFSAGADPYKIDGYSGSLFDIFHVGPGLGGQF